MIKETKEKNSKNKNKKNNNKENKREYNKENKYDKYGNKYDDQKSDTYLKELIRDGGEDLKEWSKKSNSKDSLKNLKERVKAKKRIRERRIIGLLKILTILAIIGSIYFWFLGPSLEAEAISNCLRAKGIKLYCSDHLDKCQEQKRVLGDYISRIDYVNCDYKLKLCDDKGYNEDDFPVWEYGSGVAQGKVLLLSELSKLCD